MHGGKLPIVAFGTAVLALLVVFFPSLFFGRVISPLDALYNTPPWRATHRPVEVTNPDLSPAATVSLSLMEAAHRDGTSIDVWNPYAGCGGPGTLTWSDGLLSPAVLPFVSWIDPARLPNVMILVKLLLAFGGMWLLLGRLGLDDVAASAGAVAYALAGSLTANWFWPSSATAAALPLVVWGVDTTLTSKRPWRWLAGGVLAWLVFLSGGAPGVTAVGCVTVLVWVIFRWVRLHRRQEHPGWTAVTLVVAPLVAFAVLAPSFELYSLNVERSAHRPAATEKSWGGAVARLLINPFAFGDPRQETFEPPVRMGALPFHDTVLSVGFVTLVLALMGAATGRWEALFWLAIFGGGLLCMAWMPGGRLPGLLIGGGAIRVTALAPVVALAAAVLAGLGTAALERIAGTGVLRDACGFVIVAIVLEQGMFAGHLLAFLPPGQARWAGTRGLSFLESQAVRAPERVAPLGDTLTPDTAQAYGLEDLRSRQAPVAAYRRLLAAIDPQVGVEPSRGLRLNAATVDLEHPYLRALGARWVVEDPRYSLVEFSLGQDTIEVEPRHVLIGPLGAGSTVSQDVFLPRGCSRLAVNAGRRGPEPVGPVVVDLVDEMSGRRRASWQVPATKLADDGFVWLNLPPGLDVGHRFRLTVIAKLTAGALWLRRTSNPHALDGRLVWNGREVHGDLGLSFDVSGYVPVYNGSDLRIWEDRQALPRFWMVSRVIPGGLSRLLKAQPPLDLKRLAAVPAADAAKLAALVERPVPRGRESLALVAFSPATYELRSTLQAPALMVSSVPAQPALWSATIDGHRVQFVTVNGLFLGLPVPAGTHRIDLRAGLSPGRWAVFGIGMLAWIGLAIGSVWPGKGQWW